MFVNFVKSYVRLYDIMMDESRQIDIPNDTFWVNVFDGKLALSNTKTHFYELTDPIKAIGVSDHVIVEVIGHKTRTYGFQTENGIVDLDR